MKISKYIIISLFLLCVAKTTSQTKIDTLLFVRNACFNEWKEYDKNPADSTRRCYSITLIRKEIDNTTYMLQSNTGTITFKKVGRKLFFKNKENPQYKLLFDFGNLKGGDSIKRPHMDGMYKIVYSKIKYKDKYLYGLGYRPIGFWTSEHHATYYFNEDGECVMIFSGGFDLEPYLRIDYFDKELSYDYKKGYYFDDSVGSVPHGGKTK